jgi:hypothetical protein
MTTNALGKKGDAAQGRYMVDPRTDQNPLAMARQQSARNTMGFSSLSEWSVAHIESIFQATSHDQAMRAVDETFANDVEAYMNGTPIDVEGIKTQVLGLRRSSRGGLRVRWKNIVEAPNRPGSQAEVRRLQLRRGRKTDSR